MCEACPQVNTCCCGCSLRTGTIIIGVLGIIGSLATIASNSYYASIPIIEYYFSCDELCKGIGHGNLEKNFECFNDCREAARTYRTCLIVIAVIHAISLIPHISLLVGVFAEKPTALLLYVYSILLLQAAETIVSFLYVTYHFAAAIRGVLTILLYIYFVIVVYSLYRTMMNPSQQTPGPQYSVGSTPSYPYPPQQGHQPPYPYPTQYGHQPPYPYPTQQGPQPPYPYSPQNPGQQQLRSTPK